MCSHRHRHRRRHQHRRRCRHRQARVDDEGVAGVSRVSGPEGRKDEVLPQVVSRVGSDSLERHDQEADGPVADLNEGDDGDASEEAESAPDGRDHVEDARPKQSVRLTIYRPPIITLIRLIRLIGIGRIKS